VLDRVEAEAKRVRESGLRHAKSIADGLHVNIMRHVCLESFLLSGKKSLNIIQAVHHLVELRFHANPNSLVLHWTPSVQQKCTPLDTNGLGRRWPGPNNQSGNSCTSGFGSLNKQME
jgi:hypothetical protein